jgi:hypothetical protein
MRVVPEIYGQDADGNRGRLVYDIEIEYSEDAEWIEPQLAEYLIDNDGEMSGYVEVRSINPYTEEDIDIDVDTGYFEYMLKEFTVETKSGDVIKSGLTYEEAFDIVELYEKNTTDIYIIGHERL